MTLKTFLLSLLLSISTSNFGQTKSLTLSANLNLPKDSIVSNKLVKSLNDFLSLKEKSNKENIFVEKDDLLETSLLLDEIKKIERNTKTKEDAFYKAYLTNIVQLDTNNFLVEFSYMGINEKTPVLAASFEVLAKQKGNKFYFSSPLKRNTVSWKSKKIGNCTFHFKNTLNSKVASDYVKRVTLLDKKLKTANAQIEWYGCRDFPDVLQNIGVDYKIDYNGKSTTNFSANENNTLILVSGNGDENFNSFDPHDLWHERARFAYSRDLINKPVDEGCAYLYGGSWGISWQEILKTFKEKVASNPKTDWLTLALYTPQVNFGESQQKHLMADYVVNALLVEKIEKEKGFSAVIEFLCSGKNKKGGSENYFVVLEKLTGINKDNFNARIWELIAESKV
ncbi:hypothetical protein [Flavobacterium sp. MDT1-60]|uniref:hypothetical protein n=1 Tax=Flavobacterium sp. MDT1-60 TaxID=1979344 RepID=UPI00177A89A8|nr:hypothetical protein [Flavobacterium sp. MDT1-60]QOG02335.1 hypothetical protein IHE43_21545 [Flavobacterium sp. MDT1-60]